MSLDIPPPHQQHQHSHSAPPSPSPSSETHLAYVYSWPLVGQFGNTMRAIDRLDFEAETKLLQDALSRSHRAIRIRREVATSQNLRTLVTLGCRALHYTGHGLPGVLAFEDGQGLMHNIEAESLHRLFSAGGGAQGVKLVFVSACHSEAAGKAFVGAGVPHVIAVRNDSQVADICLINFTMQFYLALLMGRTVKSSYNIALEAVRAMPQFLGRANNENKFLLLPEDGDHEEAVFDDIPIGEWEDLSEKEAPNNLIAIPTYFRGRNFQLQNIVGVLLRRRLVGITGPAGIGKTTLANAAASYMWKRGHFKGVYWVSFAGFVPVPGAVMVSPRRHHSGASDSGSSNRSNSGDHLNNGNNNNNNGNSGINGANGGGWNVQNVSLAPPVYPKSPSSSRHPCSSMASVIAREIGLSDIHQLSELIRELRDKEYLLILDGVDAFVSDVNGPELCVRHVVEEILTRCQHMKMIISSENGAGTFVRVAEYVLELRTLAPNDAAELFYNLAPRRIDLEEFGCHDSSRAVLDLAQHEALRLVSGHPRRIFEAAQLLKNHKMHELPQILRQRRDEDEKSQAGLVAPKTIATPSKSDISGVGNGGASNYMALASTSMDDGLDLQAERDLCAQVEQESGRQFWRQLGNRTSVSWDEFEAAISKRFVESTEARDRPLSPKDLRAIKNRLIHLGSAQGYVSRESFGLFWNFYSRMEECIAMNLPLWLMKNPTMIHGLMSRVIADSTLKRHPPGTFLLRFSENNPGCIAVAYVDHNGANQHILIRMAADGFTIFMNDGELTYPTLQDLILKCRPLQHLYPGIPKEDIWQREIDEINDLPA